MMTFNKVPQHGDLTSDQEVATPAGSATFIRGD